MAREFRHDAVNADARAPAVALAQCAARFSGDDETRTIPGSGDAPCILRRLDRDAAVRMDDDLCEGQLGQLVRNMELAKPYWSKRAGIWPFPRDTPDAKSGSVHARLVSCGCRAQTSFLEQGRNADAHASLWPFREMNLRDQEFIWVATCGRSVQQVSENPAFSAVGRCVS